MRPHLLVLALLALTANPTASATTEAAAEVESLSNASAPCKWSWYYLGCVPKAQCTHKTKVRWGKLGDCVLKEAEGATASGEAAPASTPADEAEAKTEEAERSTMDSEPEQEVASETDSESDMEVESDSDLEVEPEP
ncbi:hypothetical protein AB1Y20_015322 [Prymnesium parvum]|uniref:Uncharacterized protein n=1 Tax=Prymnesium parvum TaxID=97485 RepID=A0AB34K049_PRYPA